MSPETVTALPSFTFFVQIRFASFGGTLSTLIVWLAVPTPVSSSVTVVASV